MFSFTNAYLLWFVIPTLAALIYAYLQKNKKNKQQVSSIVLLKKLRKRTITKKKVKLPIRFFYELLILLLLLLAIAGIVWNKETRLVALVVDNSLSMSAAYEGEKNVLDQALAQTKEFIDSQSNEVVYKIFTTSPSFQELSKDFIDRFDAKNLLQNIDIFPTRDTLNDSLSSLQGSNFHEIVVFSDKLQSLDSSNQKNVKIRTITTNKKNNLVIENVRFTDKANLQVLLKSHSEQITSSKLIVDSYKIENHKLSKVKSLSHNIIFKPKDSVTKNFKLLQSPNTVYKLSLDTKDNPLVDSISSDSEYLLTSRATEHKTIQCFSQSSADILGLSKLFNFEINCQHPKHYDSSKHLAKLSIFHGFYPDKYKGSALIVLPGTDPNTIDLQLSKNPKINFWSSGEVILKYLKPKNLKFNFLVSTNSLPWFKTLIGTTGGPALLSGEKDGGRTVISGFELFPYEGKENKFLSILFLNILDWLQSAKTSSLSLKDAKYHLTIDDLDFKEYSTDNLSNKKLIIFSENYQPLLVKNYSFPDESNLLAKQYVNTKIDLTESQNSSIGKLSLIKQIIYIVLALLILGWIIWDVLRKIKNDRVTV